ncbi:hypothetical protein TWF694_009531 [Orbilia ellipsospora]|uniref:Amine oxidase domain-containing protein n=1 Tax=Orbilia ellipsospora TaxID=2528407 RepID=A0AAV9XHI6_9PEZI
MVLFRAVLILGVTYSLISSVLSISIPSSAKRADGPSNRGTSSSPVYRDHIAKEALKRDPGYQKFTRNAREYGNSTIEKVGIIGAGICGLYTALLLDSMGIAYEILEANPDHVGGRMWTYRFNRTAWENSKPGEPDYYDYFELGAMRWPNITWQKRLLDPALNYSLINIINNHPKTTEKDKVNLIKYVFTMDNNTFNYNDVFRWRFQGLTGDPFKVGIPKKGNVPENLAKENVVEVYGDAFKSFTTLFDESFADGWKEVLKYDDMSVRTYLREKAGLTDIEIDWLETVNDATGHYELSVAQLAVEQWLFSASEWVQPLGGMDRVTYALSKIVQPIYTNTTVTKISAVGGQVENGLNVSTSNPNKPWSIYSHVINTAPLGAVQAIDMTDPALKLTYEWKSAIRKLNYDASVKVGIKFKYRWWQEDLPYHIFGGESYTDRPSRRHDYPSYGMDVADAPGTMIASYTWSQDALRLSSYLHDSKGLESLKRIVLTDLSKTHNVTYEYLEDLYVDMHAYSWYDSPYSVGGFALFTPSQFSTIMPRIATPVQNRIFFAGEALSSGHAWVIGALNSAVRAVAELLSTSSDSREMVYDLCCKWGWVDELEYDWYVPSDSTPTAPGGSCDHCKVTSP